MILLLSCFSHLLYCMHIFQTFQVFFIPVPSIRKSQILRCIDIPPAALRKLIEKAVVPQLIQHLLSTLVPGEGLKKRGIFPGKNGRISVGFPAADAGHRNGRKRKKPPESSRISSEEEKLRRVRREKGESSPADQRLQSPGPSLSYRKGL